MIYLKSFKEMEGKTIFSVMSSKTINSRTLDSDPGTEYTLFSFTDNCRLLLREDLGYDPFVAVVDDKDECINDKVRSELSL